MKKKKCPKCKQSLPCQSQGVLDRFGRVITLDHALLLLNPVEIKPIQTRDLRIELDFRGAKPIEPILLYPEEIGYRIDTNTWTIEARGESSIGVATPRHIIDGVLGERTPYLVIVDRPDWEQV